MMFDKNFRYTTEAAKLDSDINMAVTNIIKAAFKNGESPREIEYVASQVISDICLDLIMGYPV